MQELPFGQSTAVAEVPDCFASFLMFFPLRIRDYGLLYFNVCSAAALD